MDVLFIKEAVISLKKFTFYPTKVKFTDGYMMRGSFFMDQLLV